MNTKYSTLIFLIVISTIYVYPLLLVDQLYSDDYLRYASGSGWSIDGRPLSTLIMQLLSGSKLIKNLAPTTLILAAIMISISGLFVSNILDLEKQNKYKISSFLLLTSPLMIENLLYKYDVFPMSLSFFLAIIPFQWKDTRKRFLVISTICILLLLLTYQASIVLYGLMAICLLIQQSLYQSHKEVLCKLFYYSLPICVGIFLMKFTSTLLNLDYSGRDKTIFSSENPFITLKNNIKEIYGLFHALIDTKHYYFFFIFLTGIFIFCIYNLFIDKKIPIYNKIIILLFCFAIPTCLISIPLVLQKTYIVPRIFVGFSFILYCLLILLDRYALRFSNYVTLSYILIALPLMAATGNLLKEQSSFQEYVISDIINQTKTNEKAIIFNGELPFSKNNEITLNHNFILRFFYIKMLGNENFVIEEFFNKSTHHTTSCFFLKGEERQNVLNIKHSIPITHKTNYYYIRSNEEVVIVDFDKEINIKPEIYDIIDKLSTNITYNLESIEQNDTIISMEGWAFFQNQSFFTGKKSILLKSSKETYICSNIPSVIRKDVSDNFNKNLDQSGFKVLIEVSSLPKDVYTIGLLLENRTDKIIIFTDKTVAIQ